jgi:hypothetical protein
VSGGAFGREFHDLEVVDRRFGGAAGLLQTASWRLDKAERGSRQGAKAAREEERLSKDLSKDVAPHVRVIQGRGTSSLSGLLVSRDGNVEAQGSDEVFREARARLRR